MAFSVAVYGIPRDHGTPVWKAEAAWWNAQELREDPRFRETECPESRYLDYVAVLRPDEASELHKTYKPSYKSAEEWPGHWWQPHYEILERGLSSAPKEIGWVMVVVFEWESGMN